MLDLFVNLISKSIIWPVSLFILYENYNNNNCYCTTHAKSYYKIVENQFKVKPYKNKITERYIIFISDIEST